MKNYLEMFDLFFFSTLQGLYCMGGKTVGVTGHRKINKVNNDFLA